MRILRKFPVGPDVLTLSAVIALAAIVYLCSLPATFQSLSHRKAGAAELMGQAREHVVTEGGLFTALAAQGFALLAEALTNARGHFADAALAYVRFALEHPGHYQVMFNKSLLDVADTELAAAEAAAGAELSRGVAALRDPRARADPAGAQLAAWSLVHGFSTLWLNDAVNAEVKETDPMESVLRIATMLFEG